MAYWTKISLLSMELRNEESFRKFNRAGSMNQLTQNYHCRQTAETDLGPLWKAKKADVSLARSCVNYSHPLIGRATSTVRQLALRAVTIIPLSKHQTERLHVRKFCVSLHSRSSSLIAAFSRASTGTICPPNEAVFCLFWLIVCLCSVSFAVLHSVFDWCLLSARGRSQVHYLHRRPLARLVANIEHSHHSTQTNSQCLFFNRFLSTQTHTRPHADELHAQTTRVLRTSAQTIVYPMQRFANSCFVVFVYALSHYLLLVTVPLRACFPPANRLSRSITRILLCWLAGWFTIALVIIW